MKRKIKNILFLTLVLIGSLTIYGFTSRETSTASTNGFTSWETGTASTTGICFDDIEVEEVHEDDIEYYHINDCPKLDSDSELPCYYEILPVRLQNIIASIEGIESVEISFSTEDAQIQSVLVELQITNGKVLSDDTQSVIRKFIASTIENMSEDDVFINII